MSFNPLFVIECVDNQPPLPHHLAQRREGFSTRLGWYLLYPHNSRRRLGRYDRLARRPGHPIRERHGRVAFRIVRCTAQRLGLGSKPLNQQSTQPFLPAANRELPVPIQQDGLQRYTGIELYGDADSWLCFCHDKTAPSTSNKHRIMKTRGC
ncbi:MAG: hypothetical protein RPU64_13225 [Candidatus Sedimenticola sp. (ex Thyasira tokunagai)]